MLYPLPPLPPEEDQQQGTPVPTVEEIFDAPESSVPSEPEAEPLIDAASEIAPEASSTVESSVLSSFDNYYLDPPQIAEW